LGEEFGQMKRRGKSKTGAGLTLTLAAVCLLLHGTSVPCPAEDDTQDLAEKTQNPVSDLISLPFQNNTNFKIGPHDRTQNVLNIQPVIPVKVGEWNLINRTILPLIYQPDFASSSGGEFGLGDINHTTFLSPAEPGALIWGVGPTTTLPTSVNDRLGPGKFTLGPSAVVLTMPDPFVIGALIRNEWSVAGDGDTPNVNQFLLQYFVNFNFGRGTYLTSSPIVTANWKADSGDRWVVPLGGGIGQILPIGAQPFNFQVQAFWNAERPSGGPEWTLRTQVQMLFPK
jgi:hypothetical protein